MGNSKELYSNLTPLFNCIDYTVSNESYEVLLNKKYDLLVTLPVPFDLENYYLSNTYISHTDSKKSMVDKVYQLVKTYTLKQKVAYLNLLNTDKKTVLDVGAGTGDFLKVCKNNGWNVCGIEPSKQARMIANDKGIFLNEDLSELDVSKKYDVITLWHVLEHVKDLFDYIQKLKKLLKPNGYLIVAVPNYKSYDATYYKEFWAAFDVPRHLWHFSQTAIKKLFLHFDMEIVKTTPMKFDAYYVALLSEKYKHKKTNFIKSFYIGFVSNLKAARSTEYSSLTYTIQNIKKTI